jgi:hypothetical protein
VVSQFDPAVKRLEFSSESVRSRREAARLYSLPKNSVFRSSEGAGGFSLPNKAQSISRGFSHGPFLHPASQALSPSSSAVPQIAFGIAL